MKLLIRLLQLSVEIKIAPVARSCLHLRTYPEMSEGRRGGAQQTLRVETSLYVPGVVRAPQALPSFSAESLILT